MTSQNLFNYSDCIDDLDAALIVLSTCLHKLRTTEVKTPDYRVRYDNHKVTLAIVAQRLLISIRRNCIHDGYTIPLAYFCIRTLQDVCIKAMSINFAEVNLDSRQGIVLKQIRLLQTLANEPYDRKSDMLRLLGDEKPVIGDKLFKQLKSSIEEYDESNRYTPRGFQHDLSSKADRKLKSLFDQFSSEIYKHPILIGYSADETNVMFSNMLHGNFVSVLVASEDTDTRPTIPFMLLRLAIYDASVIAAYLDDERLSDLVENFCNDTMSKYFGGVDDIQAS